MTIDDTKGNFDDLLKRLEDELANSADPDERREIEEDIRSLRTTKKELAQMEREVEHVQNLTAEQVEEITEFYKVHADAIGVLYGSENIRKRDMFIDRLTVTDYENIFNSPAPAALIDALDMPAKTSGERDAKTLSVYNSMDLWQLVALYEKIVPSDVISLPTSSTTNLIDKTFSAIAMGRLPEGAKNGDFSIIEKAGGEVQIIQKGTRDAVILTLHNPDLWKTPSGSGRRGTKNRDLRKIYAFILVKCAEQGFRSPVVFSIHDMVDAGMYANYPNARKGIIKNIDIIYRCLDYSIKQVSGKSGEVRGIGGGHGFISSYEILKGSPLVTLNIDPNFNIQTLATFYTILPKWAFSLDPNPFALLEYVFGRGRQNCDAIKKSGSFNVNLDALRNNLGLPAYTGEDDYNKIKRPLLGALDKVEEAIVKNSDKNIKLTPMIKGGNIDTAPVREWLNNGYVQVELSGHYAEYFVRMAEQRTQKIQTAKRNGERARARKKQPKE